METVRSNPRISCSINRKINLGKYENLDVHIGYSDDIASGEKTDDAFLRVERKTVREFERLMAWIEGGKVRGAEKK